MTPQETAKSLYEDFYHLMPRTLSEKVKHDTAKLCALKHVEVMIQTLPMLPYWPTFKQEIQKL